MKLISAIFFIFLICAVSVFAQDVVSQNNKTLTQKEFSFDYPADWKLIDKSSNDVQQFNLVPPSGNVLIMIVSYDTKVPSGDIFAQIKTQTSQFLSDKIYMRFNQTGKAKRNETCTQIENIPIPGTRITGFYDKNSSTADIFYLALNQKFFNFIYLRDDAESSKSDAIWKNLLDSFRFENLNRQKPDFMIDWDSDMILNGRAVKLAKPLFPSGVKVFNAVEINVRVIIDESGKVISAKAISGNNRFFPYAESAAKDSKFEPFIVCGKHAKISGVIVYRFVGR